MEMFFIGLNIALFFGALAGLVGLFALPFLANMIVKNRNKIGLLEEANRFRLDDIHLLTQRHHRLSQQIDGIESDLEKAKLSSIAPATPKTQSPKKKTVLDKIKVSGVESELKKQVYHLSNTKQGGKRANKSRSR